MNKQEYTLTEIAKLLNQPQHRLIYFCEKEVVLPDFSDAKGRGSSRRFSSRNIFEFSLALVLSEFHFPASITANILYILRKFEDEIVSSGYDKFSLPQSLMQDKSPEILAIITNGSIFNFSIGFPGKPKSLTSGVDIKNPSESGKTGVSDKAEPSLEEPAAPTVNSNIARFELNLTKLAQTLNLD